MPSIYVLCEKDLNALEAQVRDGTNLAPYHQSGPFQFPPEQLLVFPHQPATDPPEFVIPADTRRGRAAADFEHALQVYSWIGPLSETEARDPRLWAWMSHVPFADYTRARWPVPTDDPKRTRNSILDHWFVRGEGRASLRRHSIARLWWGVHLTQAPWEHDDALAALRTDDPYVYTRVLLGNQDVFFHTLEREFGSNHRILIAMLDVIRRSSRAPGPLVEWLAKEANLACRYRELDLLPIEELISLLESLAALETEAPAAA